MLQQANPLSWDEELPEALTPIGAPEPSTGILENLGAMFEERLLVGNSNAEAGRFREGYDVLLDAINEGRPRGQRFENPESVAPGRHLQIANRGRAQSRAEAEALIFAEIARRRRTDPRFLAGIPNTADEYREQINAPARARLAEIHDVQRRATTLGTIGGFAGGMAGSLLDPPVAVTLPFGGFGRAPFQRILTEGLVSGSVELALQPSVAHNYRTLGVDYGLGDAAISVLMAATGGAAVRGLFEGARPAGRILGRVYDRTAEATFNAVPEALQRRWADAGTFEGRRILEGFRRAVPEDEWLPDERAAVAVIERNAEVRESSPFAADHAGDAEHLRRLSVALDALTDDMPPPLSARLRAEAALPPGPLPEASIPRSVSSRGTSAAREQLKARIRRAESGGDDAARNPRSSATGRYQFVDRTWLRLYRRRYASQGLSDGEVLALRRDPRLQEQLMDDLTAHNGAVLRRHGHEESAGNLYLLHFAGDGGGVALLRAAPDTPAGRVLGAAAIAANPHLRGRTAADVIAWAHRAVGGDAPAPARLGGGNAAPGLAREAEPAMARRDPEPSEDWREALERLQDEAADEAPVVMAEPLPSLRRDLFESDEDWAEAQLRFNRELDQPEEIAASMGVNGPPARETAAPAPEGRSADAEPERASATVPKRATDVAGNAYPMRGEELPSAGLAPANLSEHGVVYVGRRNTIHFLIDEAFPHTPERGDWAEVGFISPRGEFLSREQALDWVDRNEGRVSPSDNMEGQLDALDYREQIGSRRQEIDSPALARFDAPDSEGVRAQIASIEHDLKIDAEAGAGPAFRLGEEGDELSAARVLDEADAELGFANLLKGCL